MKMDRRFSASKGFHSFTPCPLNRGSALDPDAWALPPDPMGCTHLGISWIRLID